MAEFKIFKVNAIPETPQPNAVYQVLDASGESYTQYVTKSDGTVLPDLASQELPLRQSITEKNTPDGYAGAAIIPPVNSSAVISNYLKRGDTYHNLISPYTGVPFTANSATEKPDGNPITDSDLGKGIYFKFPDGYAVRNWPNGIVNVDEFGAKGDGVTDDSVAINRAYEYMNSFMKGAVNASGGGYVEFTSNKKYAISSPIQIKLNVKTKLNGTTIIAIASMDAMFKTDPLEYHVKNAIIGDFAKLDCNLNAQRGIWFKFSAELEMYDIFVDNCLLYPYQIGAPGELPAGKISNSGLFSRLVCDNQRPHSAPIGSIGIYANISDSKFINCLSIGYETGLLSTGGAANRFINYHGWARLYESEMKYAIIIEDSTSTLINCYADTATVYGVWLKSGRNLVEGTTIFNNEKGSSSAIGIRIESSCKLNQILGTHFDADSTRPFAKDIEFGAASPIYDNHTVKYSFGRNVTGGQFTDIAGQLVTPLSSVTHAFAEIKQPVVVPSADNQILAATLYDSKFPDSNNDYPNIKSYDIIFKNGIGSLFTRGYNFLNSDNTLVSSLSSSMQGDLILSKGNQQFIFSVGANNPEGVVTGNIGSVYARTAGNRRQFFYLKTTNGGNTGWKSLWDLLSTHVFNVDAASIPVDIIEGVTYMYNVNLSQNTTINNPDNAQSQNGQRLIFRFKQDATGGRDVIWQSRYTFTNEYPQPFINQLPNSITYVEFVYNSTDETWNCITKDTYTRSKLDSLFAPLSSPSLTGSPTAPTQPTGDASTKIATTYYSDRVRTDVVMTTSGDKTILINDITGSFGNNGTLVVYADAAVAPLTITLPAAADMRLYTVCVVKTDASANTVTVKAHGAELIINSNTYLLSAQGASATFKSNMTTVFKF